MEATCIRKVAVVLAVLSSFFNINSSAQVPAFPGADGYGRYTQGGRGGTVYYVTTLDDSDEQGTLRYGVTRLSKAVIMFKVSGTIHLNSPLNISASNITIAGQSAPGDGICIADYPVSVSGSQVIIRYMRFRMGDRKLNADEADGADALGGRFSTDVIIDHCSISWSTDECCSFYANTNFTMQWCLVTESLRESLHSKGTHGYGAIWGGLGASFYHNMLAHHGSRTPRIGTGGTAIDIAWIDGNGTETTLAEGIKPVRNDNSEEYKKHTIELSEVKREHTAGVSTLRFYLYNYAPGKGIGLANVALGLNAEGGTNAIMPPALSQPNSATEPQHYDLAGRRVSPDAKGIVIVNGKKVIR